MFVNMHAFESNPDHLSLCRGLTRLTMQASDATLADLHVLTRLQNLNLSGRGASWTRPLTLSTLGSLTALSLSLYFGTVLCLAGLTKLCQLELRCTHVTSVLGQEGLGALQKLELAGCLREPLRQMLPSMQTLEELIVESSPEASLPQTVSILSRLRLLSLGISITSVPLALSTMTSLTCILLRSRYDCFPRRFTLHTCRLMPLTRLRAVRVHFCQVDVIGSLDDMKQALPQLARLDLGCSRHVRSHSDALCLS